MNRIVITSLILFQAMYSNNSIASLDCDPKLKPRLVIQSYEGTNSQALDKLTFNRVGTIHYTGLLLASKYGADSNIRNNIRDQYYSVSDIDKILDLRDECILNKIKKYVTEKLEGKGK